MYMRLVDHQQHGATSRDLRAAVGHLAAGLTQHVARQAVGRAAAECPAGRDTSGDCGIEVG